MHHWKTRLRRAAISGATVVCLLSVTVSLWYRNAYTLPPEPAVSVNLPQPNGYETLLEAKKLLVARVDGVYSTPIDKDTPWPLASRQKLLAANAPALRRMRDALQQDFRILPETAPGARMNPAYREFTRLLVCSATTHAETGDLSRAAQDTVDAIELGNLIPRGGGIMDLMVGMSCAGIGEKALWDLADRLDSPTVRATAQRLEQAEARRWPYAETLREEKRQSHANTRQMFDGGPIQSWRRLSAMYDQAGNLVAMMSQVAGSPEPSSQSPGEQLSGWAQLSWMKTRTVYEGPRFALENMDRTIDTLQARSEQPWSYPRPVVSPPADLLGQILFPLFDQVEFKVVQNRADSTLLITYLALRAYRLDYGTYPESLDALTAMGYLKSLPLDPFSPTRSHLGYRRDVADRMTLWSVGPDARDDAGRPIPVDNTGKQQRGPVSVDNTGDIVARVNTW